MKIESSKYLKWCLRLTAVYLWYFTPAYILTVLGSVSNLRVFGYSFVREPYQWDFELMFAILFLVWGIFTWIASRNPKEHILFVQFTAWALVTHAGVMVCLGFLRNGELLHFLVDSVPYFVLGIILFVGVNKKYSHEKNAQTRTL